MERVADNGEEYNTGLSQGQATFLKVITRLRPQPITEIARGRDDRAPTAYFRDR